MSSRRIKSRGEVKNDGALLVLTLRFARQIQRCAQLFSRIELPRIADRSSCFSVCRECFGGRRGILIADAGSSRLHSVLIRAVRFWFLGLLILALAAIAYPANMAVAQSPRMSCCQDDKSTIPSNEPAPAPPNHSTCCPACSVPITFSPAAAWPGFWPGSSQNLTDTPILFSNRSERPPSPPPRCVAS